MEILEVTDTEYSNILNNPYHVFGSAEFNKLNSERCESIHYLLFKDKKYRLGIIGGIKDHIFHSPFSAPFGGFSFLNEDIRIYYLDEALDLLYGWAKQHIYSAITITLPPTVYHESFLSKTINSLFRKNFNLDKVDLNYSFSLENFNDTYINNIWHNARKNLKRSVGNQFHLLQCDTIEEKATAYEIIRQNRQIQGFPLRMTFDQIIKTATFIKADFFLLLNEKNNPLAASFVFHVSPEIVQVIYWGDLPEHNHLRTMNFLSYKIFEFYKKTGFRIVDIGPSTENSIPNYGLCEFKESIGCDISTKFTYRKEIV
jgi:hypothetical protein